MSTEPIALHTRDGLTLEAERARPPAGTPTIAAAVLCHPHPQFGGSMRAVVVSPLFEALPRLGVDCLRFNFRGVERSEGSYGNGVDEQLDARAALIAQHDEVDGVPLVSVGFSFGADVALQVTDDVVDAFVAIAPPLHFGGAGDAIAHDPRPKLVVLAERDDFRAASEVAATAGAWPDTRVEIVGGASHFFVGRTDRVTTLVGDFVADVARRPG